MTRCYYSVMSTYLLQYLLHNYKYFSYTAVANFKTKTITTEGYHVFQ